MRIFVAAPFTGSIQKETRRLPDDYRQWLAKIIRELRASGHEVLCAHEREQWGEKLDSPETAIHLDWEAIRKSDVLLAYLGNPPSPGVQMELGYASALQKTIIVASEKHSDVPYLVRGLTRITNTIFVQFEDPSGLSHGIAQAIKFVEQAPAQKADSKSE